ncbi:MAG: hypothetical protein A2234_08470 [Elusimicrobia bacterium RIFOXYA2_FULL_58_8]|nr:MAG: hypothetical protein A2285_04030 [Elusimicrobia bacterium RIFOXYA12_FULL_57_11]OGS12245.1 MAG: hypothetical protein A2234_08470 [Elusimicrobia bacterium RIFOXYA2_FULL_58_8]
MVKTAALLLLLPAAAAAAGQGAPPGTGRPPKPRASLDTAFTYSSPEGFTSRKSELRGEAALGSAAGLEVRASAAAAHLRTIETGCLPPELYTTALALTAEDSATHLAVTLNSNSDRPLHSPSETDLGFNFSRTFSERGPHAWLFGLNYSTRRSFSRSLPLPFITYRYATKDFFFLFPFLLRWQATRKISFSASYQPVKYYRLAANWRPAPFFSLGLEGGTRLEQFLPAGRPDRRTALYQETSFVALKPELFLSRRLRLGAELAWQLNGLYYTGKTYDDYRAKHHTGSGPATGLSAGYSF